MWTRGGVEGHRPINRTLRRGKRGAHSITDVLEHVAAVPPAPPAYHPRRSPTDWSNLPRIPEWLLMRRNGAMASEFLRRTGQTPAAVERGVQTTICRPCGVPFPALPWPDHIPSF
jgi:hypothetical protein